MFIKLLCENSQGHTNSKVCTSEWGLSLFIEVNNKKILFDTGSTDVFLKNAQGLNIDLNTIDYLVLSHHHSDHTGGLRFLELNSKKDVILHPDILQKMPQNLSDMLEKNFNVQTSDKPLEFSKDIYFLGTIPRKTPFEEGKYKDDAMEDDSAIAIKTTHGVVIITGCSHSGICNICEYAKEVTGQKIYAVIGGFHLFADHKKAVEGTIKYFEQENISFLYPLHCVEFPVMSELHQHFNIEKFGTGDTIQIPD